MLSNSVLCFYKGVFIFSMMFASLEKRTPVPCGPWLLSGRPFRLGVTEEVAEAPGMALPSLQTSSPRTCFSVSGGSRGSGAPRYYVLHFKPMSLCQPFGEFPVPVVPWAAPRLLLSPCRPELNLHTQR